jgi:asparagine synthase (glutamine-hydrolysing)
MPGLVGFINNSEGKTSENLIYDMAHALDLGDKYITNVYHEQTAGIGRVTLRDSNPGPQPLWNEAQTICLVMDGELYAYASVKQNLIDKGYQFQYNTDAEFLLQGYLEFGEEIFTLLNGAYVVAIWNRADNKLVISNDRLGLHPLYYGQIGAKLVFASGIRSLLVDPSLSRTIDRVAIAEFLTFDHLLEDRTLLQAVRLLPQGSVLTWEDNRMHIRRYWELKLPEGYELRDERDYMDEFHFLLRQAVKRQSSHDNQPAGLLLSGGMDSRYLLTILTESANGNSIHSLTWGIPGCDDARIAREVSQILGVPHHFFELKPDWLLEKADDAVRLTDGMGNLVNLHALATLEQESKYARVIYKGFLGDAMMGFGLRHQFWAKYDEQSTWQAHFQVHTDQGVITFDQQEKEQLFSTSFKNEVGTAVWDEYIAGMLASKTDMLADQRIYFDFYQRVPRMTIKGVEVVRSEAVVRLPFADNDLVEFSARVPPGLLYERRLMKNAFIKAYPKLAQVPITETGLPMMECVRDVLIRAGFVLRWHLNSAGLKWVPTQMRRPYKDYNEWFRTVLRNWLKDNLLSPRALERGYYNPQYVRKIISEHMAGANHSVRLGAMLSIELWHRQFLD